MFLLTVAPLSTQLLIPLSIAYILCVNNTKEGAKTKPTLELVTLIYQFSTHIHSVSEGTAVSGISAVSAYLSFPLLWL